MLKNVRSFVRRKVLPDSGSELPVSFAAKTVTTVCVDCSQSPVFREIVKIEGLPVQTAILISYVPRGRGLDHPRWPPITQSARSRRPKGKIGGRARANDFPRHLLLNVTHIKREMSEQESVHNQHN